MTTINFISIILDYCVSPWRWMSAIIIPILIAKWGLKKKSLDTSGAITGRFDLGKPVAITSFLHKSKCGYENIRIWHPCVFHTPQSQLRALNRSIETFNGG